MDLLKLNNEQYLFRHYGKYKSGLVLVLPENAKDFVNNFDAFDYFGSVSDKIENIEEKTNIQMDGKIVYTVNGEYRINKKGTKIFDCTRNQTHTLVCFSWGGAFNKTRGWIFPEEAEEELSYFKRASSNGGGIGNTYIVFPIGWNFEIKENMI